MTINKARAKLRTKGNYTKKERSYTMENTNASVSQSDTTNDVTNDTQNQPTATTAAPAQDEPTLSDLTDDEAIDLFIYGMMEEKGTAIGSDQVQATVFKDLKNQLLQEIDRSLIAELPDDKIDELNKMAIEKGQIDPNLIADMIEEANLDAAEIIGGTMAKFREIYLGNASSEAQKIEEEA